MDVAGRWLPEGVGVEPTDDGRVRLRGGEFDGRVFDSVGEVREFARRQFPDLGRQSIKG